MSVKSDLILFFHTGICLCACVCVGRGRKFRMEWNQKEFRVYVCGMNQESYLKKKSIVVSYENKKQQ